MSLFVFVEEILTLGKQNSFWTMISACCGDFEEKQVKTSFFVPGAIFEAICHLQPIYGQYTMEGSIQLFFSFNFAKMFNTDELRIFALWLKKRNEQNNL